MASHYVNNADFLKALKDYKERVKIAQENNQPKPQVNNYIGECILKIANHLSYKPNFINYTYRDEMISDGIENCIMYIDNFNPEKSSNPFAYFTQIIYFAFLRRIQKEKKQTYIKGKIIMDMPFEAFNLQGTDDDGSFNNSYVDFIQNNNIYGDIIQKEELRRQKTKKKKGPSLDEMIDIEE
jgi:hypothetical protein